MASQSQRAFDRAQRQVQRLGIIAHTTGWYYGVLATTRELEMIRQQLTLELKRCISSLQRAKPHKEVAFKQYAQICSRSIAEKMLVTLPRELRDDIYTYLWDGNPLGAELIHNAYIGFRGIRKAKDFRISRSATTWERLSQTKLRL